MTDTTLPAAKPKTIRWATIMAVTIALGAT